MKRKQPGYSIEELAGLAGTYPRTIWHWTSEGVFEPPPFRGPYTRYDDSHVEQLRRILEWRASGLQLDAIRERLAQKPPPPPAPAMPPPQIETAPVIAESLAPPPSLPPVTPEPARLVGERWQRIVLVPGVELHVNLAIDPYVRALVEDICSRYGSGVSDKRTTEPPGAPPAQ